MKLKKSFYETFGKAIADIGKGIVLASLIAYFITSQGPISASKAFLGLALGLAAILIGSLIVQVNDSSSN